MLERTRVAVFSVTMEQTMPVRYLSLKKVIQNLKVASHYNVLLGKGFWKYDELGRACDHFLVEV